MATLLPDVEEHFLLSPYDLLSLKDARVPAGAFAIRPLNEAHVQQLMQTNPLLWPDIIVTLTSQGYVIIDGYHRWEAAKRKQIERMKATCRAYASEADVVEAAFQANLTHGLKANLQTRGDYAYWLHVTFPDILQEEIAKRAVMTQGAVSKAISKRDTAAKQAMQQQQEETAKERERVLKRACSHFTKVALTFFQDIGELADEELAQLLSGQMKTPEDRQKLARIGRLLSPDSSPPPRSGTEPLRLRQFVSGGPTTGSL